MDVKGLGGDEVRTWGARQGPEVDEEGSTKPLDGCCCCQRHRVSIDVGHDDSVVFA